jgi:hypothetical protein
VLRRTSTRSLKKLKLAIHKISVKTSFRRFKALDCVTNESGSKLDRIKKPALNLKSIVIPPSVRFIAKSAYHIEHRKIVTSLFILAW